MIRFSVNEPEIERDYDELLRKAERVAIEELTQSGYNIAYAAMLNTAEVIREMGRGPEQVRDQLEAPATHAGGTGRPPTVAQAVIQSRRARRGKKGLYGDKMRRAEQNLIRRKMLGAYYIAAGWLEPQKILARLGAKAKPYVQGIVDYGLPDGDAIPPKPGRHEVTLINLSRGALRIGGDAAKKALEDEAPIFLGRLGVRLEQVWNEPAR